VEDVEEHGTKPEEPEVLPVLCPVTTLLPEPPPDAPVPPEEAPPVFEAEDGVGPEVVVDLVEVVVVVVVEAEP